VWSTADLNHILCDCKCPRGWIRDLG
jgi:hypothetical protein